MQRERPSGLRVRGARAGRLESPRRPRGGALPRGAPVRGAAHTRARSLRAQRARPLPAESASAAGMDRDAAAVHIWGPVMVLPYAGPNETLSALELLARDPTASGVSVIVADLGGAIIDEARLDELAITPCSESTATRRRPRSSAPISTPRNASTRTRSRARASTARTREKAGRVFAVIGKAHVVSRIRSGAAATTPRSTRRDRYRTAQRLRRGRRIYRKGEILMRQATFAARSSSCARRSSSGPRTPPTRGLSWAGALQGGALRTRFARASTSNARFHSEPRRSCATALARAQGARRGRAAANLLNKVRTMDPNAG